jgi:hypothetical protein
VNILSSRLDKIDRTAACLFIYLLFTGMLKQISVPGENSAGIPSATVLIQRGRVIERINDRTMLMVVHSFCQSKPFLIVRLFSVCLTR